MIEVFPNLFVGSGNDLIHADNGDGTIKPGWFVISAAKDPYHRELLGYTGRGAPKDHPEYLLASRTRRLFCNLVDAEDPAYIRDEIVSTVIVSIDDALGLGHKVLVHCNKGQSRAPVLAMLYLRQRCHVATDYDDTARWFRAIYPDFEPAKGMEGYARAHWEGE